jgi:hypothetical protein
VKPCAGYLNVDLEIRSHSNLTPLVEALRPHLFVLYAGRVHGGFLVTFEVSGVTVSPDVAIRRLAQALSALPPSVRRLWTQARDRVFDIGLEQAAGQGVFTLALRPDTVRIIDRLNARVGLTLYPRARGESEKRRPRLFRARLGRSPLNARPRSDR